MTPHFVISCLPRSGSAWLSTCLNTCSPDILCVHEGLGRGIVDVSDKYRVVGSCGSDSLFGTFLPRDFSGKRYYLHRDEQQVKQSLIKCGVFTEEGWEIQLRMRDYWLSEYCPTILEYDKLVDSAVKVMLDMECEIDWNKLLLMPELRVVSKRWNDSI